MKPRSGSLQTSSVLGIIVCLCTQILAETKQPGHTATISQACTQPIKTMTYYNNSTIKVFHKDKYPNNQECTWQIAAPMNQLISFGFTDFDLAQGDYVLVRDGVNESAVVLKNFSDSKPDRRMSSSSSFLWIKFKSAKNFKGRGFIMDFMYYNRSLVGCAFPLAPEIPTSDSIVVPLDSMSDYYYNNMKCAWQIVAPENQYIRFAFEYIHLGPGDFVEIRDGMNESSVLLGNATRASTVPWVVLNWFSSGRYLWVKFTSDEEGVGRGFYGYWSFLGKLCLPSSPKLITSDTLSIKSPFSPAFYPNNQECTWVIKAPLHQLIRFTFTKIALAQGDFVEVRDGRNESAMVLQKVFTKTTVNASIWRISSGRYLRVTFTSDEEFTGLGFKLKFVFEKRISITACLPHLDPMVMNSTSGNISYPLVDYILFNKQECKWLIMVPKEKLIVFRLQKLVVVSGDYLVVRDGRKENAVILKNFTSKPDIKEKWISQGQYLLVKFKSDELNAGKEFELIWESMDRRKACSHLSTETIKGDVSTLNGPYVDKHYPNNHECTWIINVSRRRVVAFVLKKFDLAKGDYLEIRDGKSENAGLLKNYTTEATSLPYKLRMSTGQYLRVKFKSDHQYVGKGFIITTIPQPKPTTPFPPLRTTSWTKLASTRTTTPQFDQAPNTSHTNTDATAVSSSADLGMGLGFGLVALIVISSLLCLYIRKNRIKRRSKNINEPWEIALSQVELLEELGQGAFGKVWKGRMYRKLLESDDTDKSKHKLIKNRQDMVAVKTLHDGATAEQRNEFLREIEFMKDVGCHRNIISMVACCTKEEQVFLVVELAQHGDLLQLLKGKRKSTYVLQAPPKTGSNSGPDSGDEDTKQEHVQSLLDDFMSFAWQIAQGMEYLSSKGIVHRDLATRNILVADDRVVKVADFGLSRHMSYVDQVYQAQGRHKLPLKWMSPEAIDDQIFTSKSDVWSYGVLLWEIYSMGKLPYRTVCNQRLLAMLKKGHRMDKPDLCPDDVYQIMKNCWQEHAQDRPSFIHVIQTIEMLMTRDTPYVELMNMEMNEGGDRYLMPVDDSDSENDVSETVV